MAVSSPPPTSPSSSEPRPQARWLGPLALLAPSGPWLLLLLLPLVALTFRRGGYALVALLAVGVAPRAVAGFWQDLWRTRDQQAAALPEQGDAERAAQLFDDPDWQASAAYQAGNYADAAQTFAARRDVDGLYNAGTALARAGEFDAAIETLQAALQIDPEHADARFNLDLLQSMQNDDSSQSQARYSNGMQYTILNI